MTEAPRSTCRLCGYLILWWDRTEAERCHNCGAWNEPAPLAPVRPPG